MSILIHTLEGIANYGNKLNLSLICKNNLKLTLIVTQMILR